MKVSEPKNVRPYDQNQCMLFPAHLKEFIEENDLCRVIDDVVNTLDLSGLYRNVSSQGNMAYHPKMMLKVLFYAYASGIFSSRKIAKALGENVAFIFLAAWQRPDFRTISYFRKNNLEAIRDLFGQIVLLCQKLNMVKLGHISIDGSKFKANAADRRSYDQKRIDKEVNGILDQADQVDRQEDALYGPDNTGDELPEEIRNRKKRLEKLEQIQKELNEQGKKRVNATDPDGDPLTYSIISGNTNDAFAIGASTGELTVNNESALDFETTPAFSLMVEADDGQGGMSLADISINLNDIDEDVLGIEDPDELVIYPNPVDGPLIIEFTSLLIDQVEVSVYSLDGRQIQLNQVLRNQSKSRLELDLSELSMGLYLLKIKDDTGFLTRNILVR